MDVTSWLLNFEIFGYWTHRLLHVERICGIRVPIYKWVHQPHHHYKRPTAFCAQAITGLEGVYFAATSVIVSLVFPTSSLVQYGLGSFMLIWSIAAHDSDGRLDGGFHYEHHHHPTPTLASWASWIFFAARCGLGRSTTAAAQSVTAAVPCTPSTGRVTWADFTSSYMITTHGIRPRTNAGKTWK